MKRTAMEMSAYRQAKRAWFSRKELPQFLREISLQPHCKRALWLGLPKQKRGRRTKKVRIVAWHTPTTSP